MWKTKRSKMICFPNEKTLDLTKFKPYRDDKIKVIEKMEFVLQMVNKIVKKRKHAGYQHFLLFPRFPQSSSTEWLKVGIVWERVNP